MPRSRGAGANETGMKPLPLGMGRQRQHVKLLDPFS